MNKAKKTISRRTFLKTASAAMAGLGFPTIVPASVFGQGKRPAPSSRIVMDRDWFWASMAFQHGSFLSKDDVQWVAVCDIDKIIWPGLKRLLIKNTGIKIAGLTPISGCFS